MDIIRAIHAIPFVNERDELLSEYWERDEQLDAIEFVRPDHCVLELGGRYGVVSCVINSKLANKSSHFVVEPDTSVINALTTNKINHDAEFTIYNGIVSKCSCSISLAGSSTNVTSDVNGNISFITIPEIIEKYKLKFTCFIADCEGCIQPFIQEFPEFFVDVDTILIEEDNKSVCDYTFVSEFFTKNGFTLIKKGFHSVWLKQSPKEVPIKSKVVSAKKYIWNRMCN